MWVKFSKGRIVIGAANIEDAGALEAIGAERDGHLWAMSRSGTSLVFAPRGAEAEVRLLPINITSDAPPPLDLISNFAATPFVLDRQLYASVEGFWQSLRFADRERRARIAGLAGREAKRAGAEAAPERFDYEGASIIWGTFGHWELMRRACRAKFQQNDAARAALLSTIGRPLAHITRRDSRSIPGVIMAKIWMQLRAELAGATADDG